MNDLQKAAAWIAFCTIGGGVASVLLYWLLCLSMDRLIGPEFTAWRLDRSPSDLLWTFLLGASMNSINGGLVAWTYWRRRRSK